MARAIWTGSLSFGLVNVPVGLYAATDDKTVHFNQLQRDTSDRVRNKRVNERTGEEVSMSDIVKGYDIGGGNYVVVEPAELDAVQPGRSNTIEITDFVELSDIDPVYYKSAYYLAPKGRDAAGRAYALLLEAMAETNRVGIATFVMRGKEHLVAIRPGADCLTLETMYFADEVRDPAKELDTLPETKVKFSERELDTAKLLIDAMAADWTPSQYEDTYRSAVEEMIERKSRGEVVSVERPEEPAPVVDLMEALRASVDKVRSGRGGSAASSSGSSASAKPAAKKTAARKTSKSTASSGGRGGTRATKTQVKDEDEAAEAERKPARRKAS